MDVVKFKALLFPTLDHASSDIKGVNNLPGVPNVLSAPQIRR